MLQAAVETKSSERDDTCSCRMGYGFIYAHLEDGLLGTAVLLYHMMTGALKALYANCDASEFHKNNPGFMDIS